MNGAASCAHCGLPLGCLVQQREVNGERHDFCCYGCCLAYQVRHGANDELAAAIWLIRVGVGAFLAMNIMLFSLLLYADAFAASPAVALLIPWLLWALATPLLLMLGGPFFSGAWQALREGCMGSDTLVVLATTAAYGYSAWHVVHGTTHIYFDTVTMVLLLFTLGRYLEAQARARTAHQLAPLLAAERAQVRLVSDATETLRPVSEIKPGDRVRVLPGERIAVDGEVIEGVSSCDETILTGQPQPQPKQPGSCVHAGSVNGNAMLLLRVTAADTRWMQISRQVRTALARKSNVARMVERIAAGFVPLVLLLALGTFWYWDVVYGDVSRALLYGMAVLVVACPCSLGLAAPLAATLGLGRAAQHGIVIRGGVVLERLASVRGIAFDKTGTLTTGVLQPWAVTVVDATESEAVAWAKALAQTSSHPRSRAIVAMAEGTEVETAHAVVAVPGAGIRGEREGSPCALGSARFMASLGWNMPAALRSEHRATACVYVGWVGQVHARIDFTDAPRAQLAQVIGTLQARGLRTLVLSGDDAAEVARTAMALGIKEWHGELSPETKVTILRHWQTRHGPLAMVGDEMNDGPVLATAQVGIAVGEASDFARESADVTLPHIEKLPWLLLLAWQVRRSTRANLAWAFGYNTIALALAASGYLQPIFAAALMAGSSLLVVSRSIRAHGWAMRKDTAVPLVESE